MSSRVEIKPKDFVYSQFINLNDLPHILKLIVSIVNIIAYHAIYDTVLSKQSRRQCFGLLNVRSGFEPQARHRKRKQKVLLRQLSLSRLLAKTLSINKIAMKNYSKNLSYEVDFKLQLPSKLIHNISGVRNQINNPD